MSIRANTRVKVKAIMLDAIGPAKVFDMAEVDRKVEGWVDDLMQTVPYRLAELAEQNQNWKLAVIDAYMLTWERDPAAAWNAGYRKVVEE